MPEQTITPEQNEVSITRSFQAPLAAVWETWTSADDFTVWFGARPGSVELDVTPGGRWQAVMETPGGDFPLSGCYREVVEHEKLTWTLDFGPEPVVMSAAFSETGGETTIVYTQDSAPGGGDEHDDCGDPEAGAKGILDSFEQQLYSRLPA